MAHQLGQHLHDLVGWPGPMTHRQFKLWQEWLAAEWNKPDRHDHYVMQVAQKVQRQWSKKPNDITIDGQRIPFKSGQREPLTAQQASEVMRSKSAWVQAVGGAREAPE